MASDNDRVKLRVKMVYTHEAAESFRRETPDQRLTTVRAVISRVGLPMPPESSIAFNGKTSVRFGWYTTANKLLHDVCSRISNLELNTLRQQSLQALTFRVSSKSLVKLKHLPCGVKGGCQVPATNPVLPRAPVPLQAHNNPTLIEPIAYQTTSQAGNGESEHETGDESMDISDTEDAQPQAVSTPLPMPPPLRLTLAPRTSTHGGARSTSTFPDLDDAGVASVFRKTLPRAPPGEQLPSPALRSTPMRASPTSIVSCGRPDLAAAAAAVSPPPPVTVPPPLPPLATVRAPARQSTKPLGAIPANTYTAMSSAELNLPPTGAMRSGQGQAGKVVPVWLLKPKNGSSPPVAGLSFQSTPGAAMHIRQPAAERAGPPSRQPQQRVPSTKRKQPEDDAGSSVTANVPGESAKRARTSNALQTTHASAAAMKGLPLQKPTSASVGASQPRTRPQTPRSTTVPGGALKASAQPHSASTMSVPRPVRPEAPSALQVDIANLRTLNAKAERRLQAAQEKLSTQTAELQKARAASAEEVKRRLASDRSVALLTKDAEALRRDLEQERDARTQVESALQKHVGEQLALLQGVTAVRSEAEKAHQDCDNLRSDLVGGAHARAEALEAELNQQRASAYAAEDALNAAQADAKSAKNELCSVSDTLQRERETNAQIMDDNARVGSQLESVKAELHQQRASANAAEDALKAAQVDARSAMDELRCMSDTLQRERKTSALAMDDKSRVTAELERVKAELRQQRASTDAVEDALKAALADARAAKDELRCMSDTLQRERTTSARSAEDLSRAHAELERITAQLGELSSSHYALKLEHEQRQQGLADMKTAFDKAENERNRAETQNQELLATRRRLEEQCATHEQVIAQVKVQLREEAERAASVKAELVRANKSYGELSDERVRAATMAEEHERDLDRQLREARNECETIRRGFQEHVAKAEADLAGKIRGLSEDDPARLVHFDALKRQNFKLVAKLEDISMENRAHAHSLKAVWDAGQALLATLGASDSESQSDLTPRGAYGDLEAMMRRLSAMKKLQPESSNMRATLDRAKGSLAEERRAKEQLRATVQRERAAARDATDRCHRAELSAFEERKCREEAEQEAAEERKRRTDVELVVHEIGHAATLAALAQL